MPGKNQKPTTTVPPPKSSTNYAEATTPNEAKSNAANADATSQQTKRPTTLVGEKTPLMELVKPGIAGSATNASHSSPGLHNSRKNQLSSSVEPLNCL
jgi:hypothetical protein